MFSDKSPPLVTDQDLHAFVDGELDGRRYRRIVARLAADTASAERVNGFLRQHGELALLREELADLDPMSNDRTAELTRQLAGTIRHQRRFRTSVASSGIAACLLVGLWTVWGPDPSKVAERLSWPRQMIDSGPQVLFGRDPFGGTAHLAASESDESPLLQLDEQLAAYSIRRPDFAAFGLRFVGGNALQGGETPAIRLVYEDQEDRPVFLFLGAVGSDADVALTLVPEGHISLNWRRGSLVFVLIGPKDSEQLLDVMDATSDFLAPASSVPKETAAAAGRPATSVIATSPNALSSTLPPSAGSVASMAGATSLSAPVAAPLPTVPATVAENTPKPL